MAVYEGRGLHGQIVERIGGRIVGGSYLPGATLFADDLEREFEVSKTVVREALKVLAAKGLVESRQKRGTVVRPRRAWNLLDADVLRWQGTDVPDFAFLENLAEVRVIIEPAGARLAAKRRTEEDLAELEAALDAMAAAGGDVELMAAADVHFHQALLESAHNELLSRMEVVLSAGLRLRDRFVHHGKPGTDPVPAHRALLDAIRAGEAELAGQRVESLLAQSSADLADVRAQVEKPRRGARRPD